MVAEHNKIERAAHCRLRAGMTCRRLAAMVRQPSALWRQVEFKAGLEAEGCEAAAEQFAVWLAPRAGTVEKLTLGVQQPEDDDGDLSAVAHRCVPLFPAVTGFLVHRSFSSL